MREVAKCNEKLTPEELDWLRDLYELGQEMSRSERRRRGLGYKGLAAKFGIPVRTVRCYVHYQRRVSGK